MVFTLRVSTVFGTEFLDTICYRPCFLPVDVDDQCGSIRSTGIDDEGDRFESGRLPAGCEFIVNPCQRDPQESRLNRVS